MKVSHLPFSAISQLSTRDVKFQMQPEQFKDFLNLPFSLEAFGTKIKERAEFPVDRELLTRTIKEQYAKAKIEQVPSELINRLSKQRAYTVTTAHQPSLLTGPLYFIYKIVSVINLAERLGKKYDEDIIPIFIIGSEDHDFEEVNHLSLFGKSIVWENDEGGAVGRMSTETLNPILEQVYEILGESENAARLKAIISSSFDNVETYNTAVFRMVQQLFAKYDLLILLTDNPELKRLFIPHIRKEIIETPSQQLIIDTQEKLEAADFKAQAHAREINFFYLQEGRRDRIELEDGRYKVLDTDVTFTKSEIEAEIENHPERFSPNVVMRPIYQETILPNLAYLGGGGEIAYWTERKSQFEAFKVSFPILIRRNSVLWIGKGESKLMEKYGVSLDDLSATDEEWVQAFVKAKATSELDFTEEFILFQKAYEMLSEKATAIDTNLGKSIEAGGVKAFKSFEQLSSRLLRTEKDRHETDIKKIRKLHEKLFPTGNLQERKDNFMAYYLKHGPNFIEVLKQNLDPFNPEFVIITEG